MRRLSKRVEDVVDAGGQEPSEGADGVQLLAVDNDPEVPTLLGDGVHRET